MTDKINLLITGGAGFIGSNLVEHFLKDDRVAIVRVLDDLSNGYYENIKQFEDHPKFEFIQGDICDYETCLKACEGINRISHQAALGSVPRSIENPIRTNEVNVGGTLNILYAAKQQGVDRIILAFSSSTYGDHPGLPKEEDKIGKPLSPYAVSKAAIEQYAEVFGRTYGLDWVGFRYFNIFGPKQNPDNPYAAVIPIFCKAFLEGGEITMNGDGETSRDFTFVENAVLLNELGLFTENKEALNQVYNGACGDQISLNEMVGMLENISGKQVKVTSGPERVGDVKHSRANITKAMKHLGYKPIQYFEEGLRSTYEWLCSSIDLEKEPIE
jgi:UDP-N-acetylglucosamine/UDP-N-acetylgalactosamine 4-epimerase